MSPAATLAPGRRSPSPELVEIPSDGWRDPLGSPSRLGDWLQFVERALAAAPWSDVLTTWFPRLAPGSVASATHPLIRTGHAVRALRERETPERVAELGQALGYWADAVGIAAGPREAAAVPGSLVDLVDAAVTRYATWAPSNPTMLVHMATAPRAALLVLPSLPTDLWPATFHHAWATSAAIAGMYRPAPGAQVAEPARPTGSVANVVAAAVATHDEHAIRFAEVAAESDARRNPTALTAAGVAAALLA